MYNVCLSSEIYRLAPEDLLVLPDAPAEKKIRTCMTTW